MADLVCAIQSPNHHGPVTRWVPAGPDARIGPEAVDGPRDFCTLHAQLLGATPDNPNWRRPTEEEAP